MKSMRWGVALSVLGGAFLLAGCQEPVKMVTAAQMEHYRQLERLNEQQSAQITSLQVERERLTRENESLLLRMQDKDKLLAAQNQLMGDLRRGGVGQTDTSATGQDGEEVIRTAASGGLIVRVPGDILFDAGSATLKSSGQAIIKKIAAQVKDKGNRIEVRGYTDSQPIRHSAWKSNFELSGARALSVLNLLKAEGISSDRLQFSGYGDNDLLTDANGREDPKRSRRVEVFISDEQVSTAKTPAKAPAAAPTTTLKKDKVVPK